MKIGVTPRAIGAEGVPMGVLGRMGRRLLLGIAALLVLAAGWLYVAPPDLIRVATGYSAKIVCSNVFLAGRSGSQVLAQDVQAPGHPILRLVSIDVDRTEGTVAASLLGLFASVTAVARPGTGCAVVPHGQIAEARRYTSIPAKAQSFPAELWPVGEQAGSDEAEAVAAILDDPEMAGPGMRAIVVVKDGQLAGERYGDGFVRTTPLLGWSMTKTVTAAIIGTLVGDGRLELDQTRNFAEWSDARGDISLEDLLAMSSGLAFNEDYGDVTDVTRMLYLEPDMAAFAASKELEADRGTVFSYSSGTSVMLSRIWQDRFASPLEALIWPRTALFDKLGMDSAVLETDASGTFVGSSYLYATARDWARFGQFLLQDGVWEDEQILPEGFVAWMREPAPASGGDYGRGQLWLRGPSAGTPEGENPDAGFDLPDDAFWMLGHDGQSMAVIPSEQLVVLRMGLTPSSLGYKSQRMVEALVGALR
jgi:CubicO group peptidase (beta-lactamase class C family)